MLILRKLEGITLYFTIFFISIQLSKHFWPDFSFVNGIRIDYLSPTVYLSDIFVVIFLILHVVNNFRSFSRLVSKSYVLPLFLSSILLSSLFAQVTDASFYWNLKAVEMIAFGFCIANYSFNKKSLYSAVDALVLASLLQSVIVFLQFVLQRSIGGAFYYLGERSFNIDTIGISTFFTNGKEILRPYGTFPHPNVLALFLSLTIILLISLVLKEKNGKRVYFYIISFIPIILALLLTASRVIIFLTLIAILVSFVRSKRYFFYSAAAVIIVFSIYMMIFSERFFAASSILEAINIRLEFISSSFTLFNNNALFGVGPNNTFFEQAFNNSLPIYARFQPVHNVYLHLLLQIGILGMIPIVIFLLKVIKKAIRLALDNKKAQFITAVIVFEILTVGLFDHFPVTLQQGALMAAFAIGLLFNKSMESA